MRMQMVIPAVAVALTGVAGIAVRRDAGAAQRQPDVAATTVQQPTAPDLILHNGRIITVDATDRVVQAIAITDAKVVAVGSDADVLKLAGARTRRVDLKGRAVTPGLLDAHAHFSGSGGDALFVLDAGYPNVKSIREIGDSVRGRAAGLKAGEWIQGRGWDEGKFAERRMITAQDLDAASPNNPVYLTNTTGHYGVANSLALKLAGVTKDTKDPPAGTIDRNADGSPTGVLKEAAQGLVRRLIPPRSRDQTEQGMRMLAKAFNAEGMTGLKDPNISGATFDTYKKIEAEGCSPAGAASRARSGSSPSARRPRDRTKPLATTMSLPAA